MTTLRALLAATTMSAMYWVLGILGGLAIAAVWIAFYLYIWQRLA